MEARRWVDIGFVAAGLIAFIVLQQVATVAWDFFKLPFFENWVMSLPDLVAVLGGTGVFLGLRFHQKSNVFSQEVIVELSKVTYPAKKETALSAVVVAVMVGIASVILILFDVAWGTLTKKFLAF